MDNHLVLAKVSKQSSEEKDHYLYLVLLPGFWRSIVEEAYSEVDGQMIPASISLLMHFPLYAQMLEVFTLVSVWLGDTYQYPCDVQPFHTSEI